MTQKTQDTRLPLGRVVLPAETAELLDPAEAVAALRRHRARDYGEVSPFDEAMNDQAADGPHMVVSFYPTGDGRTVYVETAWTGPVTTVLVIGRGGEGARARLPGDVAAALDELLARAAGKAPAESGRPARTVTNWLNGTDEGGNDHE